MSVDDFSDRLQRAAMHLRKAEEVFVLTGAGISAESGIPTFRDADGLWQRYEPELFSTPEGMRLLWHEQPDRLSQFLREAIGTIAAARPNPAHIALAQLERHCRVTIATQNIDALHQAAGSTTVLELHGNAYRLRCDGCGRTATLSRQQMAALAESLATPLAGRHPAGQRFQLARQTAPLLRRCEICRCRMRPDVVLFTEPLPQEVWTAAEQAAAGCDVALVVGTSATVWPAAMLPEIAFGRGATVIWIDPNPAAIPPWAHLGLVGKASAILPDLVRAATGN